ncbi:hypothetical protein BaRGS_00020075 [Batillaria attramentaria]|uniref:Ribokinase n=1 Tax=Batillaria attramentaria TaxID=370345 RepID=A0ABD0KNY6_9CAEN
MDVVVVGSCMTDLVSYTPRQPKPGETVHGTKFLTGFGGKGANQCVMAAKLGAKTAMVAKLGKDSYGDNYMENFRTLGISADHVQQTDKAASGVAPITVSEDGQNSIVIVAGANLLLSEQDVAAAESVISKAKVVVCQLEVPPATSLAALKLAKSHKVCSIFNPAPAMEKLNPEFLVSCDILCANETETELLTGRAVSDVASAQEAARELHKKGCNTVIVTLGDKGSVVVSDNVDGLHVPVTPVKAVDTTGAGDAFIGALAYYKACMPSLSLTDCIKRASAIAAISCQFPGTQASFPTASQLQSELFTMT